VVVADAPSDPDVLDTIQALRDNESVIVTYVPFEAGGSLIPTESRSPLIKRVAVAVNLGLDLATGDWITYLCDDDVYLDGRFEPYLEVSEQADAVVGNANFVQESGAILHQNKFSYRYIQPHLPGHDELLKAIHPNTFICHDSIIHRKTDLRWPIDVTSTPNDWRYWCSLQQAGVRFCRIDAVGERATMPGMWRSGATQEGVLSLTGEKISGGFMKKVIYAKNITNKKQNVINSKNVSVMVYPGERFLVEDVSFVNERGDTCLFPGFALCGDFSFPDIEEVEKPKKTNDKLTESRTESRTESETPRVVRSIARVFEMGSLQVPISFEPIARIAGGTVLTTPKHEPKHPFDID